jgi:hypothetical protein
MVNTRSKSTPEGANFEEAYQVKSPLPSGSKTKGSGGKSSKTEPNPGDALQRQAQIFALFSTLKLDDKINLAKALAGMAGMVAMFPNQIPQKGKAQAQKKETKDDKPSKKVKEVDPETVAKQEFNKELKQSEVYKAFEAAKAAMQEAKKDAGGLLDPESEVMANYRNATKSWTEFRRQQKESRNQDQGEQ